MKKRLLALVLAVVTMLSVSIAPCYAANSCTITLTNGTKTPTWETYGVRCELTKKNKKAKVNVTFHSIYVSQYGKYAIDIAMKDANGRTIWAEDDSIVAKKSYNTSRKYTLGKDHSEYRLYFRPSVTELYGGAYVTVSKVSNCDLSFCHF